MANLVVRRATYYCAGLVCALMYLPGRAAAQDAATIELAGLQSQFRAVCDRVAHSVVAISVSTTAIEADDALRSPSMTAEKLDRMFDRTTRVVGSGFAIDSEGYILTNEHVVGQAAQVWITTEDRRVFPAIVVGSDPRTDLAVLKAPVSGLPAVKYADPASVRRGCWAIALGNPYGLAAGGQMSMSVGIVSATDRSLPGLSSQENRYYANLIQTTAEINPGNSGGPLFDLEGRVMGISTAVILPSRSTNGIGFAMPITRELLDRVEDLKAGREIVYGYLGASVSTPTFEQRRNAKVPGGGVIVDQVELQSPAETVLKTGDVILAVNDEPCSQRDHFFRRIQSLPISQPVKLTLWRDQQSVAIYASLRKREMPTAPVNASNQRLRWRGMVLGPIPRDWDFGGATRPVAGLMVIAIEPGSPLYKQGLRPGSIIATVAGKPVASLSDLLSLIQQVPPAQCEIGLLTQPALASVPADP